MNDSCYRYLKVTPLAPPRLFMFLLSLYGHTPSGPLHGPIHDVTLCLSCVGHETADTVPLEYVFQLCSESCHDNTEGDTSHTHTHTHTHTHNLSSTYSSFLKVIQDRIHKQSLLVWNTPPGALAIHFEFSSRLSDFPFYTAAHQTQAPPHSQGYSLVIATSLLTANRTAALIRGLAAASTSHLRKVALFKHLSPTISSQKNLFFSSYSLSVTFV